MMKSYLITMSNGSGYKLYLTIKSMTKQEAIAYVRKNYPDYRIYKVEEITSWS